MSKKEKHNSKNDLNVFTYGYIPWTYPRNWFENIGTFFRNIKWAWQRAIRGYCDWDMWSGGTYYLQLLRDSLRHFADTTHSWPDMKFATYDEWIDYLRGLAAKLDEALIDPDTINKYYKEWLQACQLKRQSHGEEDIPAGITKNYFEESLRISNYQQSLINEVFAEIATNLKDIWD